MSATKAALFVILFLSLNGSVFCQAGLAQFAEDGINDSAAVNPLFESHQVNNFQLFGPINMRKVIPIILESSINSKLVKIGDPVRAKLKENLYYGSQLLAPANSVLNGHVTSYRNGRTLGSSLLQDEDRLKSNATLEIQFDILLTDKNYAIPLAGRPVHQESMRLGADGLLYGITVDRHGKIVQGGRTLSRNQKNTYNTLRVATTVPIPAGLFLNIAAAPIVMGAVGAASPELAFDKPIDPSMNHKRLKGMAYGFITNLPGAFFVQAVVEKGNEIVLSSGDELMIDITVNHQISARPARPQVALTAPTETLIVEGKLLDEKQIVKQNLCTLPLKPYISSCHKNESIAVKTDQEAQVPQTIISDTESPLPGSNSKSLASSEKAEKELE